MVKGVDHASVMARRGKRAGGDGCTGKGRVCLSEAMRRAPKQLLGRQFAAAGDVVVGMKQHVAALGGSS